MERSDHRGRIAVDKAVENPELAVREACISGGQVLYKDGKTVDNLVEKS